jgi:hypothetical protein
MYQEGVGDASSLVYSFNFTLRANMLEAAHENVQKTQLSQ